MSEQPTFTHGTETTFTVRCDLCGWVFRGHTESEIVRARRAHMNKHYFADKSGDGVMKATYVETLPGWRGDARLYKLDPPMADSEGSTTEYVVVSAADLPVDVAMIDVMFGHEIAPCETYIFAANAEGEVANFMELDGSFKGEKDHAQALGRAGYEIEEAQR